MIVRDVGHELRLIKLFQGRLLLWKFHSPSFFVSNPSTGYKYRVCEGQTILAAGCTGKLTGLAPK